MCSSKNESNGRSSGRMSPRQPILSASSAKRAPPGSLIASSSSSAIWPANHDEPRSPGAKRTPSSLVQFTTASGASVSIPASLRVSTASSAARTPETPSKRPPRGWVSRWLPAATAGRDGSRPGRMANMLPARSQRRSSPAARHQDAKSARASASSSDSERRQLPVSPTGPMRAISMCRRQSRSASTRSACVIPGFILFIAPAPFGPIEPAKP